MLNPGVLQLQGDDPAGAGRGSDGERPDDARVARHDAERQRDARAEGRDDAGQRRRRRHRN